MVNLYKHSEKSFNTFGTVLNPLEGEITRKTVGLWSLSMTIPNTVGVDEGKIIKADNNLFRIIRLRKTGVKKTHLKVYAELVQHETLSKKLLTYSNPTCNGTEFLNALYGDNNLFSFHLNVLM